MAHHESNLENAGESTLLGGLITFFFNQVLPWAFTTISAILTAMVVMVSLFFFKRWLLNSKFLKKKFPNLYK